MKRTCILILALILVLSFSFSVCALEVFSITALEDEVRPNVYFELVVDTKDAHKISGGRIQLSYDSDVVKFFEAESENFKFETKETDGSVDIVFVESDVSSNEIFRVKFKGLCASKTAITMDNIEYVDDNLKLHQADSMSCIVNIVKSSGSDKTYSKGKSEKLSDKSRKETVAANSENEYNEETFWLSSSGSKGKVILYCVLGFVLIALVFVLGMYFSKSNDKNKKIKESKEETEKLIE